MLGTMFIVLISNMAVVVVISYLLTRTPVYVQEILRNRLSAKTQLYLIFIFGFFSVFGTENGFKVGASVANVRDLGPAIAGLIGGPWVGLGAAVIGALHRYFLFNAPFTALPCSIATLLTGITAGLVFRARRGRFIGIPGAAIFMALAELVHMSLVLLLARPYADALALVRDITLPMVLANVSGIAVFMLIIQSLLREQAVQEERDNILKAQERVAGELQAAHDIQMSMLPTNFQSQPPATTYNLFAMLTPAKEVGGDLYQFFPLDADHLLLMVGDVSDKGVPAALFMSMTQTLIKGFSAIEQQPDRLLQRVNDVIVEENEKLMFVTVFCGILSLRTGELRYSNAGHNPPLILRRDGATEWLPMPPGLVLGVLSGTPYATMTARLHPGDTLLAYTDGVTEAKNRESALFGDARLQACVTGRQGDDVRALLEGVRNAVADFVQTAPQSDDITLLGLQYQGQSQPRVSAGAGEPACQTDPRASEIGIQP